MKRTKIKYRKIGENDIELVGIENVSSIKDIADELGSSIAAVYNQGHPILYT